MILKVQTVPFQVALSWWLCSAQHTWTVLVECQFQVVPMNTYVRSTKVTISCRQTFFWPDRLLVLQSKALVWKLVHEHKWPFLENRGEWKNVLNLDNSPSRDWNLTGFLEQKNAIGTSTHLDCNSEVLNSLWSCTAPSHGKILYFFHWKVLWKAALKIFAHLQLWNDWHTLLDSLPASLFLVFLLQVDLVHWCLCGFVLFLCLSVHKKYCTADCSSAQKYF